MILVIWSHSTAYISSIGYWFTACYMSVYFFISGYTMNAKTVSIKEMIEKKSKRLLIPYIVYGVILVSLDILISVFSRDINLTESLLKYSGLLYSRYMFYSQMSADNIYFLKSCNSVLWFMTAMFGSCILAYFYFCVEKKNRPYLIILYLIITIVLSNSSILLPWSLDTIFIESIVMIAGHYYLEFETENSKNTSKLVIYGICFFIYIYLVKINPGINISIRNYGIHGVLSIFLFMIISITGSILYIVLFKSFYKKSIIGILEYIGKKSVTFMCTHVLILNIIEKIFNRFIMNSFIVGMIGILFSIIGGYIFVKILENGSKKISILRYM